ncbi:MAG: tyrosine-type recombinase/integrase [Cyanobacteria bacterium REEB67]|nr:tyrosine-type recombinase/integrase [Cyanobacteria bacterium REEB67]
MPALEKINKTELEKHIKSQKTMAAGSQKYVWLAPGVGLKLTPNKAVYIVQARIDGKDKRVRLADYRDITVEEALSQGLDKIKELKSYTSKDAEQKAAVASLTLRQALADYIKGKAADQTGGLRPKTISVYTKAMNRCFADWLDVPVAKITPSMVTKRYQELATNEGPRSNKGGAKAQASQAIRTLRAVLNYTRAITEDDNGNTMLPDDPTKRLSALHEGWNKVACKENDVIPKEKLAKWYRAVAALPNPTMSHFLLFLLFTGMRRGAASNLKWDHIDTKAKTITVPADIDKMGKSQIIPMSDYVKGLLEKRVRILGNDYVFPGDKDGECLQEPKRAIERVVKKSGVKFSCHTLRKTFATSAECLDISNVKVKHLLNHSVSGDVTAHHYITVDTDTLREPVQKIAEFLKAQCGIKADGTLAAIQEDEAPKASEA